MIHKGGVGEAVTVSPAGQLMFRSSRGPEVSVNSKESHEGSVFLF